MDQIGRIEVPEIEPSGVFPLIPDYGYGLAIRPEVVVHQFGSGNAKIEQRILLGAGTRRFTIRKAWLRDSDGRALRDFWEQNYGPYGAFTYHAPHDDGNGTTPYICRFANEPLSWEMLRDDVCSLGITLIEIPTTSPAYPLTSTVTRFPTAALQTALLSQVQQIIPLVKIIPLEAGYPAIFVSDRRCTVGLQLYQARLVEFDGISQGVGNEADEATFTFGNADRVMRDLANDLDLYRASLEFSLFHAGTGTKLDLWKGEIVNWALDGGPEFRVTAADGLYELNLPYPTRKISRTCWKPFDDPHACPFAAQGAMDLVHFPSADPATCDKGYDTPNGCLAHGMKRYYGGILAEPQGVRIKDNSTGTWGFGRSPLTSVSLVADSIYDQVMPEIYTDSDLPVNCKVAAGRDESDFYEALGIVGEGPLGAFGSGHKLDGQYHHGHQGSFGLRQVPGSDPAGAQDWFSLDQSGDQTGGDWRKVYSGLSTYKDNFAAGTAFLVIRRSDAKGLQLSRPGEHQMEAVVQRGLSGWVWSGEGERTLQVLTNPVWIVVNMLLRARGLRFADTATCERSFDVGAAIAAAAVCDEQVAKLVGAGTETQFKFRGVMQEEKPLRDWTQEVLMNCLGYYTFAFGKLKIGTRANSSAVEAFTEGNILFRSLQLAPLRPSFNHLTANFADEDYEFVANSLTLYDIDHARLISGGAGPLFLKSTVNLSGSASKSQAGRIVAVRLREELGGITPEEWKRARQVSFRTTVLALATEPGMVCSMTHPDMPGGSGEFRVVSWRLNRDYSIDIQGRTTTDSMYDLVTGPKPADVTPDEVPGEPDLAPGAWRVRATCRADGKLRFHRWAVGRNASSTSMFVADIYYVPETEAPYGSILGGCTAAESVLQYAGRPPVEGEWILVDGEIMQVLAVSPTDPNFGSVEVARGALGTAAVDHLRVGTQVATLDESWMCDMTVGTGLVLRPGMRLITDPDGQQQPISEYDSETGLLRTTLPIPGMAADVGVFADPRMFPVRLRSEAVTMQPSFFTSSARALYEAEIDLPFAGIAMIRGVLVSQGGQRSEIATLMPAAADTLEIVDLPRATNWPHVVRTLGTMRIEMPYVDLPEGSTPDAFHPISAPCALMFRRVVASLTGGSRQPVAAPSIVASVAALQTNASGQIVLNGTLTADAVIVVGVSGGNEISAAPWIAAERGMEPDSTLPQVATSLAEWLNGQDEFSAFYRAEADGASVKLEDLRALGGILSVAVQSDGLPATATGFSSRLGVLSGRRYATAFAGSGLRSELSPVTDSTGPTGDAERVELTDLPVSGDGRITDVEVYAAADGTTSPLFRIAVVPKGTTAVADTTTEAALTQRPVYPGATQAAGSGAILCEVTADGQPWLQLRIPPGAARSNSVDGYALDPLAEAVQINANFTSTVPEADLVVELD